MANIDLGLGKNKWLSLIKIASKEVPKNLIKKKVTNLFRCLNMKLQKQLSRKVRDKMYPKYVVTIPPKTVAEVGWNEGTELEAIVKDGKIILRPKQ